MTILIALGRVEKVDAGIQGSVNSGDGDGIILFTPKRATSKGPTAQRKHRSLQVGLA
jgi:hypothetical protein